MPGPRPPGRPAGAQPAGAPVPCKRRGLFRVIVAGFSRRLAGNAARIDKGQPRWGSSNSLEASRLRTSERSRPCGPADQDGMHAEHARQGEKPKADRSHTGVTLSSTTLLTMRSVSEIQAPPVVTRDSANPCQQRWDSFQPPPLSMRPGGYSGGAHISRQRHWQPWQRKGWCHGLASASPAQ